MDNTSLRPQSTNIVGLKLDGERYRVEWELPLQIEGARSEVPEAAGKPAVDAIVLNASDAAYAKIRFDEASLQHLLTHLPAIEDATTRLVVVSALWDMCRDGELNARDYLEMLLLALPRETNASIVTILSSTLSTVITSYLLPTEREAAVKRVGRMLQELVEAAEPGSSLQQQAGRTLVSLASSEQLGLLRGFVAGRSINNLELGDELRWSALLTLAAAGEDVTDDLAQMVEHDPSLAGAEYANAVRGMGDFAAAWDQLLHDESLSNGKIQKLLGAWMSRTWRRPEELAETSRSYWDELLPVWNSRTFHIADLLLNYLFPTNVAGLDVDYDVEALTEAWLADHADQPDALKRLVREGLDSYRRVVRVQQA